MTADISLDSLRRLIANVLDLDEARLSDDALFVEDLGMESLMALEIMVALEKHYRIKLKPEDFPKIQKLRDVQTLIAEKLGQPVA